MDLIDSFEHIRLLNFSDTAQPFFTRDINVHDAGQGLNRPS
jgi:hypothetical protein